MLLGSVATEYLKSSFETLHFIGQNNFIGVAGTASMVRTKDRKGDVVLSVCLLLTFCKLLG